MAEIRIVPSGTLGAEISEHPADAQPTINEHRLERLKEAHARSLFIGPAVGQVRSFRSSPLNYQQNCPSSIDPEAMMGLPDWRGSTLGCHGKTTDGGVIGC